MKRIALTAAVLALLQPALAGDLTVDGNIHATTNVTAARLVSAPAIRAPFDPSLVVVDSGSLSDDWSHLNVLHMGGTATTNIVHAAGGPNSMNLGIVKLWNGATFDIGTHDNVPMLAIANVANRGTLKASCTWNNILLGSVNGWGSSTASNTEAIVQYMGTSLGLLSVQGGSRLYTDFVEAGIVAGRLEEYSRLYAYSNFKPLLCVAYLNNRADAQIQTDGAAGAILNCPNGEKNLITGAGTLSVGRSITNTHAYAMAFGSGIRTLETNAVHARKFIAAEDMTVAGRPVATLTFIPRQGDIGMGSYTNAP